MSTGLGEFWDNLEKENEIEQEAIMRAKRQSKTEAMRKRYNFTLTDEVIPAIERLETLKVNECRNIDYSWQDSFDKVWGSVLHEIDMYEEGEESPLNTNSYTGAKNWLKSFSHLCVGGVPEEYRDKEG